MKNKIISVLSVIIILSCFFFIPKINAATLEEQKQENQEKKEQAEKELEYVKEELSDAVVKIQELDDKIRNCRYGRKSSRIRNKSYGYYTKTTNSTTKL